jgi:hypothetical protein
MRSSKQEIGREQYFPVFLFVAVVVELKNKIGCRYMVYESSLTLVITPACLLFIPEIKLLIVEIARR